MKALRICLDCPTRTRRPRCPRCEAEWNRRRNAARTQYQGPWRSYSRAMRKSSPICAVCGRLDDLTVDHATNLVMCRPCNSSRRENPA